MANNKLFPLDIKTIANKIEKSATLNYEGEADFWADTVQACLNKLAGYLKFESLNPMESFFELAFFATIQS